MLQLYMPFILHSLSIYIYMRCSLAVVSQCQNPEELAPVIEGFARISGPRVTA